MDKLKERLNDRLRERLYNEMNCWIGDLIANSDLSSEELLSRYAYEYTIKKEFVCYFECANDMEEKIVKNCNVNIIY